MKHPQLGAEVLSENEAKSLELPLPFLVCFAMFAAWQMGVIYFSGQTMSLDGRTPIPVNIDNVTLIIAAGYVLSILVLLFKPEISVWTSRITASAALISVIALFLPLPPDALAIALYIQYFCCCFLIGFETGIVVGLLSLRSTILWLSAGYGISQCFVALLHNDFLNIEFSGFRLFSLICLIMILIFYFKLPGSAKAWPRSIKKSDGLVTPKGLFAGVMLWTVLGCFLALFGNAVAEGTKHGVFVFYLTMSATCAAIYPLWKIFHYSPFRTFKFLTAIGAVGFILAIASLFAPLQTAHQLSLIAAAFLGIGGVCCLLNPLFGVMLKTQYPSRFISPAIIFFAMITVLIHTAFLEAFRDNKLVLYVAYLVTAVTLVIVYLLLEPYLTYLFNTKKGDRQGTRKGQVGVRQETGTRQAGDRLVSGNGQVGDRQVSGTQSLQDQTFEKLNYQELHTAELLLQGYSYTEIASVMKIKPNTIKYYKKELYSKLGINSKRELFALAAKRAVN